MGIGLGLGGYRYHSTEYGMGGWEAGSGGGISLTSVIAGHPGPGGSWGDSGEVGREGTSPEEGTLGVGCGPCGPYKLWEIIPGGKRPAGLASRGFEVMAHSPATRSRHTIL